MSKRGMFNNARRRIVDAFQSLFTNTVTRRSVEHMNFRGGLLVRKVWPDGHSETIVDDRNLIVTLGRRVMSRVISGAVSGATIARGTEGAIRVIRSTANVEGTGNVPTDAWVRFYQETGTANFHFELWAKHSGGDVKEFDRVFVGGVKTVSQLVSEITAEETASLRWYAEVINSMSTVDATNLLTTHDAGKAFALGTAANYTSGFSTNKFSRVLRALKSVEPAVTLENLKIARLRVGTEGHKPDVPSTGKDAIDSDEWLSASLRSSDVGGATASDDYLNLTVTYPNTAQVAFTGVLDQSMGNDRAISEFGLFTANDIMVARKNFGQVNKTNLFSIEVVWTLVF